MRVILIILMTKKWLPVLHGVGVGPSFLEFWVWPFGSGLARPSLGWGWPFLLRFGVGLSFSGSSGWSCPCFSGVGFGPSFSGFGLVLPQSVMVGLPSWSLDAKSASVKV